MKLFLLAILVTIFILGCSKSDESSNGKIKDGIYMGYFEYQGQKYWSEIAFDGNKYVEWPSGGARYQKSYGCLTVGTFEARGYKLTFRLGSYKMTGFPEECVNDMLLPGEYALYGTMKSDSIIFEKGSGSGNIKYHLLKLKLD